MKEEYFFSICLEENSIQAAIWTIKDNSANVSSVSHSANYEDDESLVASADSCLSYCIQNLPAEATEPTRSVFGVPSSWVAEGQIERKYLDKIRLICNKLSLSPTGFVVLPEAIAHLYKASEKTPISAVLIGIYPQSIDVSVFRLGNLSGSVNVSRSTAISDDVTEGLARFGQMDALPSRFLLYDSKLDDLEEIKQNLIKTDWGSDPNSNVKFLHTPQVEIVESETKMAAVSLAGAAEIGQTSKINFELPKSGKKVEVKDEAEDNIENITGTVDPASLGFSSSFDSSMPNQTETRERTHYAEPNENIKKIKGFFGFGHSDMKLFMGVIVIFFVLVGAFCAFWFLPKAQVTIFVAPKQIQGKQNVKFDTNVGSVDYSKLVVPAKLLTSTVTGDKTKTTSGTATVGTPAKGSVTFYNVGSAITIPAGTELSASGLSFSLDDDIQIASASGAASAATVKANITADGVGADGNLATGAYFSVGNYSSNLLQAKNDSALSGGSSQEVTAVSKEDISLLTNDLTSTLTNKGSSELKSNLSSDSLIIDSTFVATPATATFDHQVGSQADTVKLSETMKVSVLSVSRKDLISLTKQIFSKQVPDGYVLSDSQIDFQFEKNDVNFIINLLPQINAGKIKNQIIGKSTAGAEAAFSSIPGYSSSSFVFKPNISFLRFLPHVAGNISVILSSK